MAQFLNHLQSSSFGLVHLSPEATLEVVKVNFTTIIAPSNKSADNSIFSADPLHLQAISSSKRGIAV